MDYYDETCLELSVSETLSMLESYRQLANIAEFSVKPYLYAIFKHNIQLVPYMPCRDLQTLLARPAHVPQLDDVNDCSAVYHVSCLETTKALLYRLDV